LSVATVATTKEKELLIQSIINIQRCYVDDYCSLVERGKDEIKETGLLDPHTANMLFGCHRTIKVLSELALQVPQSTELIFSAEQIKYLSPAIEFEIDRLLSAISGLCRRKEVDQWFIPQDISKKATRKVEHYNVLISLYHNLATRQQFPLIKQA
jgi:hypothetical protein